MMKPATPTEEQRLQQFIKELTALSKKTGIVIETIGGVSIVEPEELKALRYLGEVGTGDIEPRF
ncbi:hypothetical protein [Spartinivicinus poritis]|uniref:Uncharacterized protein n=1 Tax=Spartinivicinus poritis TaxID=2994640 RepID=A0ABT5UCQ2_9GAMM|nr:hypothetical protein [Spartinivicinus sp. A2-2]MDE1463287.1 hypothetical protein [Spartinivicinus sp. A2-2]